MMTKEQKKSTQAKSPKIRKQPVNPMRHGPLAQLEEPDLLALQRAVANPALASPADILALQWTVGNQAVQRLLVQQYHNNGEEHQRQMQTKAWPVGPDAIFKHTAYGLGSGNGISNSSKGSAFDPKKEVVRGQDAVSKTPVNSTTVTVWRRMYQDTNLRPELRLHKTGCRRAGNCSPSEVKNSVLQRQINEKIGEMIINSYQFGKMEKKVAVTLLKTLAETHNHEKYFGKVEPKDDADARRILREILSGRLLPRGPGGELQEGEKPVEHYIKMIEKVPPKKSKLTSDLGQEVTWFLNLPKLSDLRPGDILLQKKYEGSKVTMGQAWFRKYPYGTKFTGHAAIVGLDLSIVEASGSAGAVRKIEMEEVKHNAYLVYRHKDPIIAGNAGLTALILFSQNIGYSKQHCVSAALKSQDKKKAKKRLQSIKANKAPVKEMMCSEFVTYCCQAHDDQMATLDALHMAPIALEDYVTRAGEFTLVGRFGEATVMREDQTVVAAVLMSE